MAPPNEPKKPTTEQIADLAATLKDGVLEKFGKLLKVDLALPESLDDYKKIAEQFLKDGKATLKDTAGKAVTITDDIILNAGRELRKADIKQYLAFADDMKKSGIEVVLTKGESAYKKTYDSVAEELAKKLKQDGALLGMVKLATARDAALPENDNEYRRIAKELIENRKFKIAGKNGGELEVSIEDLDKNYAELTAAAKAEGASEETKENQKKAAKALEGAKSFDDLIPNEERRSKIAKSVSKAVEDNTGFTDNIGNFFMAALEWLIERFNGKAEKRGFGEIMAGIAADKIAKSAGENLLAAGESKENIKIITSALKIEVMKEAGHPDKKAPAPVTLDKISAEPATEGQANPPAANPPALEKPPATLSSGNTEKAVRELAITVLTSDGSKVVDALTGTKAEQLKQVLNSTVDEATKALTEALKKPEIKAAFDKGKAGEKELVAKLADELMANPTLAKRMRDQAEDALGLIASWKKKFNTPEKYDEYLKGVIRDAVIGNVEQGLKTGKDTIAEGIRQDEAVRIRASVDPASTQKFALADVPRGHKDNFIPGTATGVSEVIEAARG